MHQTCVRLEREASARPSPGPVLPPRPLPSHTELHIRERPKRTIRTAAEGAPCVGRVRCAPGNRGGREGASGARGGVAQVPPRLPAPPIGPERDDLAGGAGRKPLPSTAAASSPGSAAAATAALCPPARLSTPSMSGLRVYSTSVTGSREIKSQQSEVTRILDGKRIQYQLVDISQDNALRDEMRALAGNPKATPPQIVNGDQYCGDYELFVEAVEQNTLQEFLKLA
ncbi:LOW QUALITY PROTEIN: SH3 domain-binding glutamic acid-rich-like protein 3 [Pan troglodytes]|uniref:LOW QUALITY PROTEIN: SH3 domain-binding glutamic acid-rich-like protein 3 n=1 Tax=Pan troglodytes TaxID=9598 RepID=UPI000237FD1B|nr:LOW QUALITY PROTEIN: SH3 domain-binding glutamic acid-rich-like protein 3 [Pan troglodytes]